MGQLITNIQRADGEHHTDGKHKETSHRIDPNGSQRYHTEQAVDVHAVILFIKLHTAENRAVFIFTREKVRCTEGW